MSDMFNAADILSGILLVHLELGREVVLYEPELCWSLSVLQDAKYHNLEETLITVKKWTKEISDKM